MTQKDKDLLIKDLYGRLLYGVECKDIYTNVSGKLDEISTRYNMCRLSDVYGELETCYIPNCRPYLFPLSSMTEEQKKEYNFWKHGVPVCHYEYGDVVEEVELFDSPESFEYLIENHFDYRGLIEKGLAIDATNLNIY